MALTRNASDSRVKYVDTTGRPECRINGRPSAPAEESRANDGRPTVDQGRSSIAREPVLERQ